MHFIAYYITLNIAYYIAQAYLGQDHLKLELTRTVTVSLLVLQRDEDLQIPATTMLPTGNHANQECLDCRKWTNGRCSFPSGPHSFDRVVTVIMMVAHWQWYDPSPRLETRVRETIGPGFKPCLEQAAVMWRLDRCPRLPAPPTTLSNANLSLPSSSGLAAHTDIWLGQLKLEKEDAASLFLRAVLIKLL